jgi:hypothetical protein
MTAIKNVAQMSLLLPEFGAIKAANHTVDYDIVLDNIVTNDHATKPEFKAVKAANFTNFTGTVQPTEYGGSSTNRPISVSYFSASLDSSFDHKLDFRRRFLTSQLDLNFAPIKLDRALVLDSGSFARSNYSWLVDESDLTALTSLLDDYLLTLNNERLHRKKYRSALNMLVANLLQALLLGKLLLISRANGLGKGTNPANIDNRSTTALCDWLSAEGYIYSAIQPPQSRTNSNFGESFIYPNQKLIRLILSYRIKQTGSSVIIRKVTREEIKVPRDKLAKSKSTKKKAAKFKETVEEIKIPETRAVQLKVKEYRQVLDSYFDLTSNVLFTLDNNEISAYGRRIFNRTIELGGRFYSNYQNIPSHDRKRIKINHEKTIELDYKSLHYNLLYSMAGVKLVGDPYIVDGYDRHVIKLISLHLLNAKGKEGLAHLARMISRSSNPKQIEKVRLYDIQRGIYERRVKAGLRVNPPHQPFGIEYHLDSIPENTSGKKLVSDLLQRHKAIRHLIGSKDIGLRLQNIDSNIMKEVMKIATSESIPLLFVHDSAICKYNDRARVKEIMVETYKSFTGFFIKVTQ